ncbi:MAG TPA: sensor histidine kinase [Rubrobacter sp.]|nr:sensor histidine kinase [Rubrobacter sp.]
MASYTSDGRLGKLLRRVWTSLAFALAENPYRPAILNVLFWGSLLVTYVFHVSGFFVDDVKLRFGAVPFTLGMGVLAALWLALPWDPRASRRRKLVAPAFMLVLFALIFLLTDGGWFVLVFPFVFANATFLFGIRGSIAYAAAPLAISFVSIWSFPYPGTDVGDAFRDTAGLAVLAAFAIGICAAMVEARRRREETEDLLGELESAHAKLERYAERVKELTVAEERARMSREMHDSLGHYLTVINVGLQNAQRFREKRPDAAWEEVEEARSLTQEALSEVRRWVRALKPLALEERAGPEALAALAHSFEGSGFDVRFTVEGSERELSGETELVLYRALQEGLTNALKHSKARRVTASLAFGEESVSLTVADDGEGAPEGASEKGFGLATLGERAGALGGVLSAGNSSEEGFALRVELPMEGR